MNWTEVTIWSPWIVQSQQLWGAPAPQNLRVRVHILFSHIGFLLQQQITYNILLYCLTLSGHPPPGDFIALGSKTQGGEPKAPTVLLKPASTGLPADRKRETSSTLPSSSGLSSLAKRPKLSTTPPISVLGRLADVAGVDKRAISPSIKEPSVIPIEGK